MTYIYICVFFTANFGLMLSLLTVFVETEMVYRKAPKTAVDPGVSQLDACIDCFAPWQSLVGL